MTYRLASTIDTSLLRNELLPEIFAHSARHTPSAAAIVCGDIRLSYAELDARANRVAQSLRTRGIGRGQFVGLWLSRSLDLHVALLGILKAGAAYVPFDAEVPAERVVECLEDCTAVAIIIDCDIAARAGDLPVPVLRVPQLLAEATEGTAPDLPAAGCMQDDPAYAIYTSGSTGKPKGVVISHRNICHYLRAANTVYGLRHSDVMFQGASVAFDLSLEEIFIPYLVGASLWVAQRETLQETDRLAEVMTAAGITVLDTVPTLLSLLPQDIPSLRIIILGGEACPPAIAERWCHPRRKVFNSYGPTEATVVATIDELHIGQPVTIGKPIPNYSCYVVDDALQPVAKGATGELLIGGPGIANGYLNRAALSAEKFIANPFDHHGIDPVLYRSGDAVSIDDNGCLRFAGRMDDQVKIRGFRVELGEIEARLCDYPGITHAAVVLRKDEGIERLAAFVQATATVAASALRSFLAEQLPVYMVPSHIEQIVELPRMVSGKVDRRALQALPLAIITTTEQEAPRTATEAALLAAAKPLFPDQSIALEADFFLELGGHSLMAAQFVSAVRHTPSLAHLTLHDVYGERSLRKIAALLDERTVHAGDTASANRAFTPPPLLRRFLCGTAQALALPVILSLNTARWLGVLATYRLMADNNQHIVMQALILVATYITLNAATVVIAIVGKWLAIGRTKPGRYPLWGVYYYRWWLAQRFITTVRIKWFQATPVMSWFLRALGASVGNNTIIRDFDAGAVDLIHIGHDCSIGSKTCFANATVIGNELVIGNITIHNEAGIDTSCVIGRDVVIGRSADIAPLTALLPGTLVNEYERWEGSPGRKTGEVVASHLPTKATASTMRKYLVNTTCLTMLLLLPPLTLLPIIPAFSLFDYLYQIIGSTSSVVSLWWLPLMAWPTAMLLIATTVLFIILLRWLVLPRVTAGTYSIYSGLYVRKWIVGLITELTLETVSSLYTTLYMRQWYRLMGAKIGRYTEISANLSGRYDLADIGDFGFVADNVVLGNEKICRGWMTLAPVTTGDFVFIGNDAVLPPGTIIPGHTLIGVKSLSPDNARLAEYQTWFGSPPLELPTRQHFNDTVTLTYMPSRWRQTGRAIFEALTVSLPIMLLITFGILAMRQLLPVLQQQHFVAGLFLFMGISVAIFTGLALACAGIKWLLIGSYQPTVSPMWSWWALRTEAVAVMFYGMAGQGLLGHLRGTPMLPWFLRLFGVKVGQGVFMDSTDLTEFDCVTIGDYCAINSQAALQTHLYEDRIMKIGTIDIKTGATLCSGATVLYDTRIGDFAHLGELAVVMKGEQIPGHSEWHGSPVVRCKTVHCSV